MVDTVERWIDNSGMPKVLVGFFIFIVTLTGCQSAPIKTVANWGRPRTESNNWDLISCLEGHPGNDLACVGDLDRLAVLWADSHIAGFETLAPEQRFPVIYALSLFFPYFQGFDAKESFYRKFHAEKKIPIFVDQGITIQFLGEHQKLTQLPPFAKFKGKEVRNVYPGNWDKRSGDRLIDDLPGEGSHRLVVVSVKSLNTVALGKNSIFYHEFAHFIHLSALEPGDVREIERLYKQAKERDQFLTTYSATNEREYFAVAVESFLSVTKTLESPNYLNFMAQRADLRTKDPELYQFISKHLLGI